MPLTSTARGGSLWIVTPEEQQLLDRYEAAQAALVAAKETEQSLRKQVVRFFSNPTQESGRERRFVDNNIELVMDKKQNFKVINDNGQLDHIRSITPFAIFNELFTCTWSVSVSAYKKLTHTQQVVVDYCLLITDGMPSLEVKKTDRV